MCQVLPKSYSESQPLRRGWCLSWAPPHPPSHLLHPAPLTSQNASAVAHSSSLWASAHKPLLAGCLYPPVIAETAPIIVL